MRRLSRWLKCNLLFVVLWFCASSNVFGQVYSFKHFGLDQSIFPSRIECLAQANTGELLVGTLAGLVVYDGFEFSTLTSIDGLAENSISALMVRDEQVWIGHWAGSITIYNLTTEEKEILDLQEDFNFNSIRRLLPLSNGRVLCVTKDGRLYAIQNGTAERVLLPLVNKDEKVVDVLIDRGELFMLTDSRILKSSDENETSGWQEIFESDVDLISAHRIGGSEWLLGTETGIIPINIEFGERFAQELANLSSGSHILDFCEDRDENIWISTKEDGIIAYHPLSNESKRIQRINGLSYNQTRDTYMDREGVIWVATSAGLDQYLGEAFTLYDKRSGLADNLIWDMLPIDDQLLIATQSGLMISKFDKTSSSFETIRTFTPKDIEPLQVIRGGPGNHLWVVDATGGIWKGDPTGNELLPLNSSLPIINCVEEVNGVIWLGTNDGVIVLNDDQPVEQYTTETGLGGDRVNGIYYSKIKNETWISTLGGQLTLFREGRFRQFDEEDGLTSTLIQDMAFDAEGKAWLASYDRAVYVLENDSFRQLESTVELRSATTFAIEIDGSGKIWIGHNWGLDVYDPAYEEIKHFGIDEGFMGVEVNPRALFASSDGVLWMGTLTGLERFNPLAMRSNIIEPLTTIKRASLGTIDLLGKEEVEADNEQRDLSIDFKGLSLVNPMRNKFIYRLRGVHENWKEMNKPEPIEYLSLPTGTYHFELKSCNENGLCNSKVSSISFTINPPFYNTWWFYTFIFFVVISLIFILDRYRAVSLLDEKNSVLEKLMQKEEELMDAQQTNDELQSFINSEEHLFKSLEKKERKFIARAEEVFGGLGIRKLSKEEFSSDGVSLFETKEYQILAMVDTGVSGFISVALREIVQTQFENNLPKSYVSADIINAWKKVIEGVESRFTKFKGISWFMLIKAGGKYYYYAEGTSAIIYDGKTAIEVANIDSTRAQGGFPRLPDLERLIVVSDGLFVQMGEGGVKNYPNSRLVELITNSSDLDIEDVLDLFETDITSWRGGMDLVDDISYLVMNNEKA